MSDDFLTMAAYKGWSISTTRKVYSLVLEGRIDELDRLGAYKGQYIDDIIEERALGRLAELQTELGKLNKEEV